MIIKFAKSEDAQDAAPIAYQTKGAAGFDLPAYGYVRQGMDFYEKYERLRQGNNIPWIVAPRNWAIFRTGYRFAVPEGYEIQIRPRSGMAFKQGLTIMNSPGTVDSDYRGEVMIALLNTSDKEIEIVKNQRIAQAIVMAVPKIELIESYFNEFKNETERGEKGFGSTGE